MVQNNKTLKVLIIKTLFFCLGLVLFVNEAFGQNNNVIEVTEKTIRIAGLSEEIFYFGFAEGDKIIFNFEEIDNKEVKEIEIIEYPSSSRFMEYKASKIENKEIQIFKQSIFKYRFYNSAVGGRICKIKIQRIPANENTINFNTNIKWITKQDTTWNTYTKNVIVGYDTTYVDVTNLELTKVEQKEELLFDKTQRVNSQTNIDNPNKCILPVELPQNINTEFHKTKVIAWAYWIGVGEEAREAYTKNVRTVGNLAGSLASTFGSPLAGLAVGAVTDLMLPTMGEDIDYWFITDWNNAQLFMNGQTFYQFDKGKGIAAYGKNTTTLEGTFYVGLYNDNYTQGIDVNVKVVAIVEHKIFELITTKKQVVKPRYEKQIFSDPSINEYEIPVNE